MQSDFNIAVLISGRGSNLKSLIDNARDCKIKAVISNNPEAGGLEYAKDAGIYNRALKREDYPSLKAQKQAILEEVQSHSPQLVCLAGFMLVLQPEFVAAFPSRIINIHPALLPSHPGLDTHKRVLEAGDKYHGCSVHVVDCGVDTGPVLAQAKVEVLSSDTPDTLAHRVLSFEHQIYPWVVNSIAAGKIRIEGGGPVFSPEARREAGTLVFILPA